MIEDSSHDDLRDRLHEMFDYDEASGAFTKRVSGRPAGYICQNGYAYIYLDGKQLLVHRMAFLMVHGWLPEIVDHADRNPLNNSVGNLRPATKSTNGANRGKQRNNKSGFKGVKKHHRKWMAQVHINGKNRYIGLFKTPEEAHEAYVRAARQEYGDFFHP